MYFKTINSMLLARGWSQSDLARVTGVSRQAVSKWLKGSAQVSMTSENLFKVSRALRVPAETLARPLPGYGGDAEHDQLMAAYLWDRLYPDLDELVIAASRWQLPAVARLVEVDGLYATEKLLGKAVWRRFEEYARYLNAVRRGQLRALVQWRIAQTAS